MAELAPELLLARLGAFADARSGWVAYSGGLDSTVLLHAMVEIRDRLGFAVRAIHVDHGLHRDSRGWAEHCALTCRRLDVPLQTMRATVAVTAGESLEAAARKERYEAMASVLERGDLLLTAQHMDDQAETFLLALMRGSGPKGLAAMPEIAPLGVGRLVRPLLSHGRSELFSYAKARSLDWLEDPSNSNLRFDRNFIRLSLLPLFRERWPGVVASIARSAAHCAEAQGLVDLLAAETLSKAVGRTPGTVSISTLRGLAPPLRKAVLRHWLGERGCALPDSRHLARIVSEILPARTDANPLVSWRGCEVRRYRGDLFAMEPLPPVPPLGPICWNGGTLVLPGGLGRIELLASDARGANPWNLFPDGLEVRFGELGLRCRPAHAACRRPLKKLFQEVGLPPWLRPYVPLLFARGRLVAVGDIWRCYDDGAQASRRPGVKWTPGRPLQTLRELLDA